MTASMVGGSVCLDSSVCSQDPFSRSLRFTLTAERGVLPKTVGEAATSSCGLHQRRCRRWSNSSRSSYPREAPGRGGCPLAGFLRRRQAIAVFVGGVLVAVLLGCVPNRAIASSFDVPGREFDGALSRGVTASQIAEWTRRLEVYADQRIAPERVAVWLAQVATNSTTDQPFESQLAMLAERTAQIQSSMVTEWQAILKTKCRLILDRPSALVKLATIDALFLDDVLDPYLYSRFIVRGHAVSQEYLGDWARAHGTAGLADWGSRLAQLLFSDDCFEHNRPVTRECHEGTWAPVARLQLPP